MENAEHLRGPRVLCARNELKIENGKLKMENAEHLRGPCVLCARNELKIEN